MLTGDVFYFNANTGRRLKQMDTDCTAAYARKASDERVVTQWKCTNGDSRDVRYFLAGEQVDENHEAVRRIP